MKRVSLKELKQNLSSWVEVAHNGDPVEVLKYNRPFVTIVPWNPSRVRIGSKAGRSQLKPCLENATRGRWQKILNEDREE